MYRKRIQTYQGLAVVALLVLTGLAMPVRAAEDREDLRKKALTLNDITGKDPMKGQIKALVEDVAGTKKLLAVAVGMAKEKEQPFNYNAAYILARTAQMVKDFDASERFYKLCSELGLKLQSGTKLGEAYLGLIALYYDSKKFAEAEKICKEFLGLDGDEGVDRLKGTVLRQMIQAIAKQEKFDEADKMIDKLLKAQPDNWLMLELRGWVQREAGKYEDAVKTYEDVLNRINKDENLTKEEKTEFANEMRYIMSGVYVDLNQIDKAAEHLKALLAQEPNNPTYNNDLGYIWADHDMNLEESEKLIRKALEEDRKQRRKDNPDLKPEDDKDNGAYLDSLGWVLYKQKKYEAAKKYLLQAVDDKDSQHIEIFEHLGDIYLALGEKGKAVSAWKKGVEATGASKREQQRKVEVEKKIKANQ